MAAASRGFARYCRELHGKPDLQVVEDRGRMCLAKFDPYIWRRASGLFLDGIELRDPADGLFCDGGTLRAVDVDELAPDMGHAGDLADRSGPIEILEPGIAVGVHPAAEASEVILGVLTFPISREPIPGGGRGRAIPGAFVAGIGPEPCRLGLSRAGGEHADRRVVGEDRLGRQDMTPDGIGEGFQQGGGLADPVGQCRAIQIEAFAVEDLALAVERQVVGILADQDMGQETRAGAAPLYGPRGQRGLDEAFAAGAGQARPHDAVHEEAPGDVFQFFRDFFPDPAQAPAAIGTGLRARGQFDLHPRDVVRDRAALGFVLLLDVRQLHPRRHRSGGDLAGLKGKLKLFRRLGRRPEPMRPVACQLMAQLLDQDRL